MKIESVQKLAAAILSAQFAYFFPSKIGIKVVETKYVVLLHNYGIKLIIGHCNLEHSLAQDCLHPFNDFV